MKCQFHQTSGQFLVTQIKCASVPLVQFISDTKERWFFAHDSPSPELGWEGMKRPAVPGRDGRTWLYLYGPKDGHN